MSKKYEERLMEGVPPDFAAGHRNYLNTFGVPLDKLLDRLMRSGDYWRVFDEQEQEQLAEFARLVSRKNVPVALVKVEKEEPPLLLDENPKPSSSLKSKLLK